MIDSDERRDIPTLVDNLASEHPQMISSCIHFYLYFPYQFRLCSVVDRSHAHAHAHGSVCLFAPDAIYLFCFFRGG
jgi:hypothetical protein